MKPLEYIITCALCVLIAWIVMQGIILKPLRTLVEQTAERIAP